MANFSGPTFEFRTTGKAIEWGYPAGASIVDLVPEDMRGVIHSHWKSFPPVLTKNIYKDLKLLDLMPLSNFCFVG